MKTWTVYRITNTVNGRVYYGLTSGPLQKRFDQHRHQGAQLQYDIDRLGTAAFTIEPVTRHEVKLAARIAEALMIRRGWASEAGSYNTSSGMKDSELRHLREVAISMGLDPAPFDAALPSIPIPSKATKD